MEGRGGDHQEAHNLYGLLMGRAGYEALRRQEPDRRPFILSRSGWAGLQRYAWSWTGDTLSTWAMLRRTVSTVLGLSLSGIPYTGPDIGGFNGFPSTELYLRWFQLAAFLPFFRTHYSLGMPAREPWCFNRATQEVIRSFLKLRVQMLPYLYSLAWESHRTGDPLVRPLFWPDAADPALWAVDDAFFLGDALLVAPVLDQEARSRRLLLPPGRWYHFWDDVVWEGGGEVEIPAPLERIPLFVRAGSVLPMNDGEQRVLHLYPPQGEEGGGFLYDDAGDGYGAWRVDRFRLTWRDPKSVVLAAEREGDYPPATVTAIQLHGATSSRVWVDGAQLNQPGQRIHVHRFDEVVIEVA
jgi:alpha-glucosidase